MVAKAIKGFLGAFVGVILGSEALKASGGITGVPSGIKSATQIGIGLGIAGHTAGKMKSMFNFKGKL